MRQYSYYNVALHAVLANMNWIANYNVSTVCATMLYEIYVGGWQMMYYGKKRSLKLITNTQYLVQLV